MTAEQEQLVMDHLWLLKWHASKMSARLPMEYDDLYQVGYLGLREAAAHFNPAISKFQTYCARRVRGAMIDHVRNCDYVSRSQRKRMGDQCPKLKSLTALHTPEDPDWHSSDVIPDDRVPDPSIHADHEDVRRLVMRGLSSQEQLAVNLYFFVGLKMKEVGDAIGICESRVSQMLSRVMKRLRDNDRVRMALESAVAA